MEVSVVIPVFEERECLEELHRRLVAALSDITPDFEILLVEDGGNDGSWELISQLAKKDKRVKALRFPRNFGQHVAISAGLDYACGNWVAVMDADLQDAPEVLPELYRKAQEGFHIVAAARRNRADRWWRPLFTRVFAWFFNFLTGFEYDPRVGVYRLLSADVVACYRSLPERQRFLPGIVHWLGFPSVTVEVEHGPRYAGTSGYNISRLLSLALSVIIAYSDRPLRLVIYLGISIVGLAALAGVALTIMALFFSRPVEGWTSLIVSLYFLVGLNISIVGVVGIYVGRIFEEVKGRPIYIVMERMNL